MLSCAGSLYLGRELQFNNSYKATGVMFLQHNFIPSHLNIFRLLSMTYNHLWIKFLLAHELLVPVA